MEGMDQAYGCSQRDMEVNQQGRREHDMAQGFILLKVDLYLLTSS